MSTTLNDPSALEAAIAAAPDRGFRSRAISEYRSVRHWTRELVNWDRANILDFGCGNAIAAVTTALRHPETTVTGIDIMPLDKERLQRTFKEQIGVDIPANFRFELIRDGKLPNLEGFELVYSWSVFEHIRESELVSVYADLKKRLTRNGVLFIQVDPLYFSPRGSHLYEVFHVPWQHLLLSIDELKDVVLADPAKESRCRLWQQFIELNRLTAEQIIKYGKSGGLSLRRQQLFVTDVPVEDRLLSIYNREVLSTNCFQALFT